MIDELKVNSVRYDAKIYSCDRDIIYLGKEISC